MKNIQQLKKLIDEVEFSEEAKKKINEILSKAESKGKIEKEDKEALLEAIKADMILDAIEIKNYEVGLEEIDKLIAGI